MEFTEILRKRRMVRSFEDAPLAAPVVERILSAGLRAPSAGFTQGVDLVVLSGHLETARYWDATIGGTDRASFPWPGLLRAPLLVVVVSSEELYRRRYAEPDKGVVDFEVPWWYVDGAFTALLLQLAAVDAGLGALFFQSHRVAALRRALGIPATHSPVGTVAIGHPAPDRPSSSVVTRRRRTPADVVHRGHW
ncbi:MAG: nitroreductase family protein [Actinomycetota bacterium]|nr:nitroreductase family protein [Actinomycetota bacterium]